MTLADLLGDAYKEGMTADEISTALEGVQMPESNEGDLKKLKGLLEKANSEAASYKKQLREKLSADEVKAKEDAEAQEKMKADYEALLRKVNVSDNKAELLKLGYDEKLADETAEAMVSGDIKKVFANQKKHLESIEKKVREDVLKQTPSPDGKGTGDDKTVTKEQFAKMSYSERVALYQDDKELFDSLNKNDGGNET